MLTQMRLEYILTVTSSKQLLASSLSHRFVMASEHSQESKSFAPKDPPKLNPPKDDIITVAGLAECNGTACLHLDFHC
jgi:hypothetical protein